MKDEPYYIKEFQMEDLDLAVSLMDECVGKNLYPAESLRERLTKKKHKFYFLVSPKGVALGYIYFYTTTVSELAKRAKVKEEEVKSVCFNANPVIGNIQSIGVKEEFRKNGYAEKLLEFSLTKLHDAKVDTVFIVCWKVGNRVPLQAPLTSLNFSYLKDAHKVWYDVPNLICPYCEGRCICDASIYYKNI